MGSRSRPEVVTCSDSRPPAGRHDLAGVVSPPLSDLRSTSRLAHTEFTAEHPGSAWSGTSPRLRTGEGWLYRPGVIFQAGYTTIAAAMLDRLLHRSIVHHLDGDSYHQRNHHARTDTLRRATTGQPHADPYPDHHRHQGGTWVSNSVGDR